METHTFLGPQPQKTTQRGSLQYVENTKNPLEFLPLSVIMLKLVRETAPTALVHRPIILLLTMMYFNESNEELAKTGGVLSEGTTSRWYDDVTSTTGMDIADYIDITSDKQSDYEEEYRDERDDSSRLAERHGC